MTVYRISSERARVEKVLLQRRMLAISAILLAGTLVVPLTLIHNGWGPALRAWWPAALIVTILSVLMTRRVSKLEDEACATFQLVWDGDSVSRAQKNSPDVVLSTAEITSIEEKQGMGFRIRTQSLNRNIWVPCEMDDYDAFKVALSAQTGIKIGSARNAWARTYAKVAVYLVLAFVALMSSNKIIAASAGTLFAASFVWVFVQQVGNPNLTFKGKRLLWLNLFVVVVFLLIVVIRLLPQRP